LIIGAWKLREKNWIAVGVLPTTSDDVSRMFGKTGGRTGFVGVGTVKVGET